MQEQFNPNCTKEVFDTWLEKQPRNVKNRLKKMAKMYEKERQNHLKKNPTILHDEINQVYNDYLATLYMMACIDIEDLSTHK
jgi:hypothetical protein